MFVSFTGNKVRNKYFKKINFIFKLFQQQFAPKNFNKNKLSD